MFMYLVVGVCTKTKRVDRHIADMNTRSITTFVLFPIGQEKDAGDAAGGNLGAFVEDFEASLEAGLYVG